MWFLSSVYICNVYLLWALYVLAPLVLLVSQECAVFLKASHPSASTPPLSWKPFTRAPSALWPPCQTTGVLTGEEGRRSRSVSSVVRAEFRAVGGRLPCVCLFLNPKCHIYRLSTYLTSCISFPVNITGLCPIGIEGCCKVPSTWIACWRLLTKHNCKGYSTFYIAANNCWNTFYYFVLCYAYCAPLKINSDVMLDCSFRIRHQNFNLADDILSSLVE